MLYVHTALLNMMKILWSTHVYNKSVTAWFLLDVWQIFILFYVIKSVRNVQSASDRALYICYNNVSAGSHGVHQYQHQIIRGVVLKLIQHSASPRAVLLSRPHLSCCICHTYDNLAFCVSHVFILCTYAGYFTTVVSVLIS